MSVIRQHFILLSVCITGYVQLAFGQTSNPSPFNLSAGNYSFTEWSSSSAAGTYPTSTVIHRGASNDPTSAGFNAANDYILAYNLSSGTRVVGEGTNGLSFLNTGTAGNLGALVLALNSTGRGNILVSFTSGLVTQGNGTPVPRDYRITLQYRIGESGTWQDLAAPAEFSSAGQMAGAAQSFSNIALPSACFDQPVVQLRWLYYQFNANNGGTRPQLRLDDIQISSDVYVCANPVTQASALTASNITSSTAELVWTNGSGSRRIVLVSENTPPSSLPQDGTTYTANNAFGTAGTELGNGFIVYNGNGSSVALSGLTVGNTYYARIFELDCNPPLYLVNPTEQTSFSPVTVPSISVIPYLPIALTSAAGIPGAPQQITVSASYLVNDLTITVTAPFEISLQSSAGYSTQLILTPNAGSVLPTEVYIRFAPPAGDNAEGTLTATSDPAQSIAISLTGTVIQSGTLPAPFNLCSGSYHFDNWSADSPSGTYPPHLIFHRFNAVDPTLSAQDIANYAEAYNLSSGTRINGLGNDGISFINLTTNGNLGAAVLALNTSGRKDIQVNFLAALMTQGNGNPVPRDYGLRLQYRIGNGNWTDLSSAVEFLTTGLTNGSAQNFPDVSLPAECNDQPELYLRWFYYQVAANNGGTRPRIRLDDIVVTSSSILPPLSDVQTLEGSEPEMISSTVTGPIQSVSDGIASWSFMLRDGGETGDTDLLPTLVTGITILKGNLDATQSWSDQIGFAALFDGNTKLADGVISPGTIAFSGLSLSIPDNGSLGLQLRISLSDGGTLQDNAHLHFHISSSSVMNGNGCESSLFTEFEAISDNTLNRINVEATQLSLLGFPMEVMVDETFSFTVLAVDDNGNLDTDDRDIRLEYSGPENGVLSGPDGLGPFSMTGGEFTWINLFCDEAGFYTMSAISDDPSSLSSEAELEVTPNTSVKEYTAPVFTAFPNPLSGNGVLHFNRHAEGVMADLTGKTVLHFPLTDRISLNGISPGIYYVISNQGRFKVWVR